MTLQEYFLWPAASPVLVVPLILWIILRALDSRRGKRLRSLVGARAEILAEDLSLGTRRLRHGLFSCGLLFALLATLQPIWGDDGEDLRSRGVDILICLDVSRSMLARDQDPDRLGRACSEIRALSQHIHGDRVGLVAFAGEARLCAPLTQDMNAIAEHLAEMDPLAVGRGGTDLGAALDTALAALIDGTGDHETVLLLTDGEDQQGSGLRVAERCRERGITVHCVGFGSTRGSKIPIDVKDGEAFLRDRQGREVVSTLDPESLGRIASLTGGEYVAAATRDRPLIDIYDRRILPMARKAFEARGRRSRNNRFQWPLMAALLLWVLGLSLTDRRRA